MMGWSPENAAQAYTEAVELCKQGVGRRHVAAEHRSTEFLAALAGGVEAKLVVQVTRAATPATVALAVAARRSGGRLVCVLSEPEALLAALVAADALGLSAVVEFRVGDAEDILPHFVDVDFALIDCRCARAVDLVDRLRLNPSRAVVVAENLVQRDARALYEDKMANRPGSKSVILPIGKGIEVAKLSRDDFAAKHDAARRRAPKRVSWAMDMPGVLPC